MRNDVQNEFLQVKQAIYWVALTLCTFIGELDKLRKAGMCLPSSSTIRKYKSYGHSTSGWKESIVEQMKKSMEEMKLPPKAKYGILCFDEVKVKEGVVYNPHTGDLIGNLAKHHVAA